ncbi:MAG: hypothetical protein ACOY90_13665, partial [Candidatus Zhuqueibacterota bacterium]
NLSPNCKTLDSNLQAFYINAKPPVQVGNMFAPLVGNMIALDISNFLHKNISFNNDNLLSNLTTLWEIYAAILAIAITVVLFLMNSIGQKISSQNIFFLFFRVSYLYPIIIFSLINLLIPAYIILFNQNDYFEKCLIILSLSFTITILGIGWFYHIVYKILSTDYLKDQRIKWIIKQSKQAIEYEVNKRLSQNIFNDYFKEYDVESGYLFGLNSKSDDIKDYSIKKRGYIYDINIKKLAKINRYLNHDTNELKRVRLNSFAIGDYISDRNILAAPKDLPVKKIIRLLNHSFKVKKTEPFSFDESEFDEFKVAIRNIINNRNPEELDDYLNIYYSVISSFIEEMKIFQLLNNTQGLFNNWKPYEKIVRDLYHIIDETLRTGMQEIFTEVGYFPLRIILLSFQSNVIFTFSRLLYFYPYIYSKVVHQDEQIQTEFIKDRCVGWLKEFVQFRLQKEFEKSENDSRIIELNKYTLEIYLVFQTYLIMSIENKDFKFFEHAYNELMDFFKYLDRNYHYYDNKEFELKLKLNEAKENNNDITNIENELNKIKTTKDIVNKKHEDKKYISFAINSWMIFLYQINKDHPKHLQKGHLIQFYSISNGAFENIIELTNLYSTAISEDRNYGFNWRNFELDEPPEGKTYTPISSDSWLPWYYCIKGISIGKFPDNFDKIQESKSFSEFRYERIEHICTQIKENLYQWAEIIAVKKANKISGNEIRSSETDKTDIENRIDQFLSFNKKLLERHDLLKENKLIEKELSKIKIEDFKSNFKNSWENNCIGHYILSSYSNYEEIPYNGEKLKSEWFGFNQLDVKGAFVDNDDSFSGWGQAYGQGIGNYENVRIFSELFKYASVHKDINNNLENPPILESILELIDLFKKKNEFSPNIIFIPHEWSYHKKLANSHLFIPNWKMSPKPKFREQIGLLENTPIFLSYEYENTIGVFNLKNYCNMKQFISDKFFNKKFDMFIKSVTKEMAIEFIKTNVELKKDKDGTLLSDEDATRNLLQKVHIKIIENFELNIINKEAGVISYIKNSS